MLRAPRCRRALLLGLSSLAAAVAPATGEPGEAARAERVLVVANRSSAISRAIAAYYREARGIPERQLIELPLPEPQLDGSHEAIGRRDFERLIRDPIAGFLESEGLGERIRVIVTTWGIPLWVRGEAVGAGQALREDRRAAVDAELALLSSGLDGSPGVLGSLNPYYGSEQPFARWREEHPEAALRFLVARLTGYPTPLDTATGVPRDVKRAIDSARAEAGSGRWLVDEDPGLAPGLRAGNLGLLQPTAMTLEAMGLRVVHERSRRFAHGVIELRGLATWGSNASADPGPPYYGRIGERLYPGTFAPRAVAIPFVSTNARSFAHPPRYGQSLAADLLRLGAAGCVGHVLEPTLTGVPRPQILLRHYAAGVPVVEAYFRSLPFLGWMNVYLGDPLMRLEAEHGVRPPDSDGDGVPDLRDNCSWIPNPLQRDSNADGYGNRCDADVDGDGVVTTTWGQVRGATLGDVETIALTQRDGRYVPAHDLDGDGRVDDLDVGLAQLNLFRPPGPAARDLRRRRPAAAR